MSAVSTVSARHDGTAELRIVRGTPTDEELAALTAVLIAASGAAAAEARPELPVRGRWNDPAHALRRSWAVGPGGWRAAR